MKGKVRVPAKMPSPPVLTGPFSRRLGWRPLLIFVLTVMSYSTAVTSPLLFDDQSSIVSNASIRQLLPLSGPLQPPRDTPVAGRPLVNLTFALNYATDGLGVRGYHVTNLAIHVVVAFLLFGVVRRGLGLSRVPAAVRARADDLALASALLWALHPLNTEVVNYLTQRSESLMAMFYLLTIYGSLRALSQQGALQWTAIAVAACFAGMASKESMVTAPVMVLLIDRIMVFQSWREAIWARRGLYVGLAASWLVLATLLLNVPRTSVGFGSGTSAWLYLLNQAQLIPRYLGLSLWPRALVLDYGLPQTLTVVDVLPGLLLMVVLVTATVLALWRWPAVGLVGAWFFITLAPASSVVPVVTEVGAERRMYLPLMALVLLAVLTGFALFSRRALRSVGAGGELGSRSASAMRIPSVVLGALCALMIVGITLRNREYASPLTMAQTIVDRWPNGRGHFLLASELVAAGRHQEAMVQFRLSSKDYPGALFALGTELVAAGDVVEGVAALEGYIKAQPNHAVVIPAREMLSSVYLSQGRLDMANEQLNALLTRVPNHAAGHRLMGDLRLRQSDPARAVVEYRESLRVQPQQPEVLGNLGFALAALNRFDEAADALREVVVLTPGDPAGHLLLGRVLAVLKKYEDAQTEFQAAVELDPDNREAKTNLESVQRLLANRGSAAAPASEP